MVLFHYRYRLQHRTPRSLRFLFSGYRLYYWEFVVMARKVCIVAMSVFLFRQGSVRYQAIAASWLLQICMFLHLKLQPFDHNSHYGRVCNRLEWLGLVSTTLTMNTGIVFGTTQDDYPLGLLENVLLVAVVLVNAAIFVVFAYYIVSSGTKKMAKEVYENLYERCRKRPRPLKRSRAERRPCSRALASSSRSGSTCCTRTSPRPSKPNWSRCAPCSSPSWAAF